MPLDRTWNGLHAHLTGLTEDWQEANRRFYDGDHWQDGEQWQGPRPPQSDELYTSIMSEIERAFVSKNAVKEVTDRHVNGVLGSDPGWTLTVKRPLEEDEPPNDAEKKLIDEATALFREWVERRGGLRVLQDALTTALLESRGSLRLYIPRKKTRNGTVPPGNFAEQAKRIFLHHPDTKQAAVYEDPDTMDQTGIFVYKDVEDGTERAEICYVDEDGRTVIEWIDRVALDASGTPYTGATVRLDDQDGDDPDRVRVQLPLGERLTVFEWKRGRLITPQVLQAQNLMNVALTMLQRNVNLGGFLERVILNAQVPGHFVQDDSSPDGQRFVREPFLVGAGTTNFIAGIEQETGEGITHATPSVVYRDPVAVGTFTDTRMEAYKVILEETQQLHALIAGDAAASGESRRQAMAAFIADLRQTKSRVDEAGAWLIETFLAWVAAIANKPGYFSELRANFDARIDAGPIPADEMQFAVTAKDAKLLSQESAMRRIGVDDPEAEKAKIEAEELADMERQLPGDLDEDEEDDQFLDMSDQERQEGDTKDRVPSPPVRRNQRLAAGVGVRR